MYRSTSIEYPKNIKWLQMRVNKWDIMNVLPHLSHVERNIESSYSLDVMPRTAYTVSTRG